MRHLFKIIGAISIVALTLATVAESFAQAAACSGILAHPKAQGYAAQILSQMTENTEQRVTPDRIYSSFTSKLLDKAAEDMKHGTGDKYSRIAMYTEIAKALRDRKPAEVTACFPKIAQMMTKVAEKQEAERREIQGSGESTLSCSGILARPEMQQFAATALAQTRQQSVPMERISKIAALEQFSINMRNVVNLDPRYSHAYDMRNIGADNVKKIIDNSIANNNSSRFIACFPKVWEFALDWDKFQKAFQQRQQEAKIEAAKPVNRLKQAYFSYMVVKRCYDVQLGYQLVYINEVEMERARVAVKAIETSIIKEDSSIDTNSTWQEATQFIGASKQYLEQYFCQKTYNELLSAAPYATPEKDFGVQ